MFGEQLLPAVCRDLRQLVIRLRRCKVGLRLLQLLIEFGVSISASNSPFLTWAPMSAYQ